MRTVLLFLGALNLGCGASKEPCTAETLKPIEDRYSTAIAEACAKYEDLAKCPAHDPLVKAFAAEQERVCK